jgi:hypothetical protein
MPEQGIKVTPEFHVPIPVDFSPQEVPDPVARAKAAFNTRLFLLANGLVEPDPNNPKDRDYIEECMREAAKQFIGDPTAKRRPYNSETAKWAEGLLNKYYNRVVEDSIKMRTYVKTRLLEESDPTDPNSKASDRLKALESLGKLSDLGMFKDNIEVSVNTKSSAELKEELMNKLSKYMGPAQQVESEVKQQRKKMVIDLNKALGRDEA